MTIHRRSDRLSTRAPRRSIGVAFLMVVGIAVNLAPSEALASTGDCNDGFNLQGAINSAAPGEVLTISGHCVGNFVVDKPLTLQGDGTTVLDGGGVGRVLEITDNYRVSLFDLTITGGSSLRLPDREPHGGGIFSRGGAELTLTRVVVEGNWSAGVGGGIAYYHGFGTGVLRIIDSIIRDNAAGEEGGGVFFAKDRDEPLPSLFISGSTVSGNSAPGNGGAIRNRGGLVFMENSTVSGNEGGVGAIMNSHWGAMWLSHVTVTANGGTGWGNSGGGIHTDSGIVYLKASLIVGNSTTSPTDGGDLGCPRENATYYYSYGFNVLGRLSTDCAVARFVAPDVDDPDTGLEEQLSDEFVGYPYPLDPLGWNGGPTPTHAIGGDSVAFDLVTDCSLNVDQRGVPRPQGEACDAGAYELVVEPPPPPPISSFFEAMPVFDAIGFNYYPPAIELSIEVTAAAGGDFRGEVVTDDRGFGWLDLGFDLVPGDHIVVTETATGVWRETTVVPLSFDLFDPVGDRLAGTAAPGAEVVLFVATEGSLTRYVAVTDATGVWAVITSAMPEALDLTSDHDASARIEDADGDTTLVHAPPPLRRFFEAMPVSDAIGFNYYPPRTQLEVRVWDWDARCGCYVNPRFYLAYTDDRGFGWLDLDFDLVPGNYISVWEPGNWVGRVTTVVPLWFDLFDPVGDRLAGTAAPGAEVVLFVETEGSLTRYVAVTDATGVWAVITSAMPEALDLTSDHRVSARIEDADGDTTLVHAPAQNGQGEWSDVSPGGTVSTDGSGDGATPATPIEVSVTTPTGGSISVVKATAGTDPPGYSLLPYQLEISAPPAGPPDGPLVLEFRLDISYFARFEALGLDIRLFKDGERVGDCPRTPGVTLPDACEAERWYTADDGDLVLRILTWSASQWAFGFAFWPFAGFYQPVDNLPIVNALKAGSAVPVKFSLGGNRGLDILVDPQSTQVDCVSGAVLDNVELTVTAGSSSLTYSSVIDQYVYVWKTKTTWAGTCRQLVLQLADGSAHVATFHFKR